MSRLWAGHDTIAPARITPGGWLRVGVRMSAMLVVLVVLVVASLLLRVIERPLYGAGRPFTPFITQAFFRALLAIIGIRREVRSTPMRHAGAVVCNHSSWLDIFAVNAAMQGYFVSKSEVARWPVIGFLASMVGTVFIRRDPKEALGQTEVFRERLMLGHKLVFFPEGTSTDNFRVLPFKTTLFQAFMVPELRDKMWIQPSSVVYHAADDVDPRIYGWWGDMFFGPHLLQVLAMRKQGKVVVNFLPPVRVADFDNRKALAAALEAAVRADMPADRRALS